MSSWLSYLLGTVSEREEEAPDSVHGDQESAPTEESSREEAPLPGLSPSTSSNINNVLEGLSEQQREAINNVLRRADASRRVAKVVVDGRHLQRYRRMQRAFADPEKRYSVEEIHRDDSADHNDFVEMDSLPEDLTVSVGSPAVPVNINLQQQYGIMGSSETVWPRYSLRNKIETFGRRLSNWFNTLDYDGDYMDFQMDRETREIFPLDPDVCSFIDVLSTGVIILALFELYESSLQSSLVLHSYCEELTIAIFKMVCSDLKQNSLLNDENAIIDQLSSQLVLHIFNDIWAMAVKDFYVGISSDAEKKRKGNEVVSPSSSSSPISTPLSTRYEILHIEDESYHLPDSESSCYSLSDDIEPSDYKSSENEPRVMQQKENRLVFKSDKIVNEVEGLRQSIEQVTRYEERTSADIGEELMSDTCYIETDEHSSQEHPEGASSYLTHQKDEYCAEDELCTGGINPSIKTEYNNLIAQNEEDTYWRCVYKGNIRSGETEEDNKYKTRKHFLGKSTVDRSGASRYGSRMDQNEASFHQKDIEEDKTRNDADRDNSDGQHQKERKAPDARKEHIREETEVTSGTHKEVISHASSFNEEAPLNEKHTRLFEKSKVVMLRK
ncbi:hypothetical protein NECAME_12448, partial [Necator americanus]